LVAFQAALSLLEERGNASLIEEVYHKCKKQEHFTDKEVKNFVKEIYDPFTDEEISDKIAEILSYDGIQAKVKLIFQSVANLHIACPKNLGDWYFTGNYPTPGGNRVVNKAYINFFEGNPERAY
ncbi:MAG: amidophosphoribosyltransferase, partial [Flavobacteriales bacterium]|nr:amidophosphoribosyltransferase [Flavobacteriales bacterium]